MSFVKNKNGSTFLLLTALVSVMVIMILVNYSLNSSNRVDSYSRSDAVVELLSVIIQDAYSQGSIYIPSKVYTAMTEKRPCPTPLGKGFLKKYSDSSGASYDFCFRPETTSEAKITMYEKDLCIQPISAELKNQWFCLDLSQENFVVKKLFPPFVNFLKFPFHSPYYFLAASSWVMADASVNGKIRLEPIVHPIKKYCSQLDSSLGGMTYSARCLQVTFKVCTSSENGALCSGSSKFAIKQSIILIN